MSFPELRAQLTGTVFATFGEDAAWSGIEQPVRIRFSGPTDEDERFSDSRFVSRTTTILVRASEVAAPAENDLVTIAGGPDAGTYRVVGQPTLGPKRVWNCAVADAG